MKLLCHACKSDDTRALSVVHGMGTAHSSGTYVGTVAGNGQSSTGVFSGGSTQMSGLAARAAPPEPAPALLFLVVAAITGYVAYSMIGDHDDLYWMIGWGVVSAGAAFLTLASWVYNFKDYPKQHAYWQKCFMCMRCGAISVRQSQ